jgi:accessory gene regulator protein AgrB
MHGVHIIICTLSSSNFFIIYKFYKQYINNNYFI